MLLAKILHPERKPNALVAALRRLAKYRLDTLGLAIILMVFTVVILAGGLAPHSPVAQQISLRLKPPGFVDPRSGQTMWLGSDHQGRDILSRILHAARVLLIMSLSAVATSAILGLSLG